MGLVVMMERDVLHRAAAFEGTKTKEHKKTIPLQTIAMVTTLG